MSYIAPEFYKDLFTCPHCSALSHMGWNAMCVNQAPLIYTSRCTCGEFAFWVPTGEYSTLFSRHQQGKIIYPLMSVAPAAEADMPPDIQVDYEEARQVFNHSPRAAAALLRLCVQKLCHELLGKKGDIHKQIGELVEKGLPSRVLKAFDTIRIFGNESVHPGTVNLNDTPDVALALFSLLNMAVRYCITEEKELEAIRALTPEAKRRDL
ncbi:DUF4145 domain-containing protein [Pseudomonas chlororaphis]|uniref:DUF4145 domain-containing protein n=1 Tax=Pseudomonas chlororaphis TaxID=587753 RepID=UPI000D0EF53A|nr:DUF4145 domain-containing protein [Pseudomonas chlororaphis]AVO60663.1 hypothetical protein C6Q18_22855 [Pseudomonas chlororaphis subsp. piscium]